MTLFSREMTLGEARDKLRTLAEDGHECPCCTQFAKVYKRKVHATMARDLIVIWRRVGVGEWFHLADYVRHPGDFAKLRYWGLIVEEIERRPDGGRSGWWQITDAGQEFILGEAYVARWVHLYDGRRLRFSGEPVSIRDALRDKFDYGELMGW